MGREVQRGGGKYGGEGEERAPEQVYEKHDEILRDLK